MTCMHTDDVRCPSCTVPFLFRDADFFTDTGGFRGWGERRIAWNPVTPAPCEGACDIPGCFVCKREP